MESLSLKKLALGLSMALTLAVPTMLPSTAVAQTSHRQKTKNQWRNLGYAGAAAAGVGLLTHNKALTVGGLAGGAYSAYRYEHDRKSQSRAQSRYRRAHHYSSRHHRHH